MHILRNPVTEQHIKNPAIACRAALVRTKLSKWFSFNYLSITHSQCLTYKKQCIFIC